MLKSWFVELTDGFVYPRNDTWKGSKRKAPDTPPMEVKNEIVNAATGGTQGATSIPAVSKSTGNLHSGLRSKTCVVDSDEML